MKFPSIRHDISKHPTGTGTGCLEPKQSKQEFIRFYTISACVLRGRSFLVGYKYHMCRLKTAKRMVDITVSWNRILSLQI